VGRAAAVKNSVLIQSGMRRALDCRMAASRASKDLLVFH
jgi:hypothetical protein